MKRILCSLIFVSLQFCIRVFAQSDFSNSIQILTPPIVFVGDVAEIKYVFKTDSDSVFTDNFGTDDFYYDLQTDSSIFDSLSEQLEIIKIYFEKKNDEYTLSISFVAWQIGKIDFPPFDIAALLKSSFSTQPSQNIKIISRVIDLKPIFIDSIVEKTETQDFRPPASPLAIPGTTMIFAIFICAAVLIFAGLFFFCLKFFSIVAFFKKKNSNRYNAKLCKIAKKKLKNLRKKINSADSDFFDADFCREIEKILRDFLEKRFSESFSSISVSAMFSEFENLCGGKLSDFQIDSVEKITQIFNRCDYIRFARDSLDSKRNPRSVYSANLSFSEKNMLLENTQNVIFAVNSADSD